MLGGELNLGAFHYLDINCKKKRNESTILFFNITIDEFCIRIK